MSKFHTSRRGALLAASWLALSAAALAGSAHAADAAADTAAAADAAAPASGERALDQVVVTAQRVRNNLQKTPISVTALNEKSIAQLNVHDVLDLRGIVPNLEILPQGGGGAGVFGRNEVSVSIRGVGTASRFFNQDPSVGVYIDDVYLTSSYNLNLGFYDIDNVQVLKGPQGTLFGKNTIGGALLVQTKLPGDTFGGYGQLSAGSYNRLDFQGGVNIPLTDKLTTRFSVYSSDVDGYINHVLDPGKSDDTHEKAARFQARYRPTDRVTVDLQAEYGSSHDHGNAFITTLVNPNASYVKNYNAVNAVPYQTAYAPLGDKYTVYGDAVSNFPYPAGFGKFTPFDQGNNGTLNLRIAWQLADNITLKSITAYKSIVLDSFRSDGTPGGLYSEYDQYRDYQTSQELQLLSKFFDNRLNLVAGLFYINQVARSVQITGPDYVDPVGYYYVNNSKFPSLAAYLQATYKLTDKLSVTGGLRYTRDHKDTNSIVFTSGCVGNFLQEYTTKSGGCWAPGPDGNTYAYASRSWTHVDPRLEIDYQWTPDVLTYASVTSGYQSGGFNTQNAPGVPPNSPYEQETIWAYETGVKSEWFDRRLRLNVAGFYQKFLNYQSTVLHLYNDVDVRTTSSAADAHESGVELETDARPLPGLGLHGSFAYLNQGYDKIFPGATGLTLATAINSAPKYQYSLSGDYAFPVGQGQLVAAVNWRWVGVKASDTPPQQTFTPAYGLLGANVTYAPPNGQWTASLWAKNLLDTYYYTAYSSGLNNSTGLTTVTPGTPREVGVTLAYNF